MKILTIPRGRFLFFLCAVAFDGKTVAASEGCDHTPPREAITAKFSFNLTGGPGRAICLAARSDQPEGVFGHSQRACPFKGGGCYRFSI